MARPSRPSPVSWLRGRGDGGADGEGRRGSCNENELFLTMRRLSQGLGSQGRPRLATKANR